MLKNKKGLTLIELLVSIVLLSILLIVFSSAYVNGIKTYRKEARTTILHNENRIVLDRIILDIKQASKVDPFSTADTLTLEIPSIDENEDILYENISEFKIDSFVYMLKVDEIQRIVDPNLDSFRDAVDRSILDKVTEFTVTYLPDVSSATEVEVTLTTTDSFGNETITINNKSKAKLRNK